MGNHRYRYKARDAPLWTVRVQKWVFKWYSICFEWTLRQACIRFHVVSNLTFGFFLLPRPGILSGRWPLVSFVVYLFRSSVTRCFVFNCSIPLSFFKNNIILRTCLNLFRRSFLCSASILLPWCDCVAKVKRRISFVYVCEGSSGYMTEWMNENL